MTDPLDVAPILARANNATEGKNALSTQRVRDLYSWAYAWRTKDGEDDTDLSSVRAANRAEFDAWLTAHDADLVAEVLMLRDRIETLVVATPERVEQVARVIHKVIDDGWPYEAISGNREDAARAVLAVLGGEA
jgi:hypothetical protein